VALGLRPSSRRSSRPQAELTLRNPSLHANPRSLKYNTPEQLHIVLNGQLWFRRWARRCERGACVPSATATPSRFASTPTPAREPRIGSWRVLDTRPGSVPGSRGICRRPATIHLSVCCHRLCREPATFLADHRWCVISSLLSVSRRRRRRWRLVVRWTCPGG